MNHIIQKYDQIQPFSSKKDVRRQVNQKPTVNVLDSISKNIQNHRMQGQRYLNNPERRNPNPGTRTPPRPAQNQIARANTIGAKMATKPNKFLVKNLPNSKQERKRNFSPIGGQQHAGPSQIFKKTKNTINVTRNNLGGSQGKNISDQKAEAAGDSLGGGSKINTKTGSMLNFGGGSRIPDNMSVMSR